MKLSKETREKLESVANSGAGQFLLEYLEDIKTEVSDVRNKLNVDMSIEVAVRRAVCDVIDEYLVRRLQTLSGTIEEDTTEWV